MILVTGGTGILGQALVPLLLESGMDVRVLTRDARHVADPRVHVLEGDLREAGAIEQAVAGATVVVSAAHGFAGPDAAGPEAIDHRANIALIGAAARTGVRHFVLLSVHGADPESPIELFRAKYQAEEALRASGLPFTIVRPTASMETWLSIVGDPLVARGGTRVFGRGENPINFVAARDVASVVRDAVRAAEATGSTITVAGPEDITFTRFAAAVRDAAGGEKIAHVPRAALRVLSIALLPFRPVLAGQMAAAVVMDTADMTAPPDIPRMPTRLAEVVRGRYVNRPT